MLLQNKHWDGDHSSNYGDVTGKIQSALWHWLTQSAPSNVPPSDKPSLTSLDFHILKKRVVWLGRFSFSAMLLKPEHINRTESAVIWWECLDAHGCHLPGDLWVESNRYICKKLLIIKKKKKQIMHAWKSSQLIRMYVESKFPPPSASPTMLHPGVNQR